MTIFDKQLTLTYKKHIQHECAETYPLGTN